jgi:hypothetical protein
MDARIEVTESELIAAILDAESSGPIDLRHGATSGEIAELLGWSRGRTLDRIKAMKHAGKLEAVRLPRETVDDRIAMVSGYRLVK